METSEKKIWYAVYTAPRAEKKVAERFFEAGIEYYLPLKTVRRQWSDRIKNVILPIITGYIFVRINPKNFQDVLNIFGAVSFIRYKGAPIAIPDEQINMLRYMCDFSNEPIDLTIGEIKVGEKITVVKGPLAGLTGELVRLNGKHKVIIRINSRCCASTTISLSFLQKG